jgi:hypothetical protein
MHRIFNKQIRCLFVGLSFLLCSASVFAMKVKTCTDNALIVGTMSDMRDQGMNYHRALKLANIDDIPEHTREFIRVQAVALYQPKNRHKTSNELYRAYLQQCLNSNDDGSMM